MKKRIAFFILAMLVTNVSVFSKTGVFFDDEDGSKAICSTSKLTEKDFLGSDFFIPNINTPYHKDLNVQIFNLLKSKELKDGIDGFGGYYSKRIKNTYILKEHNDVNFAFGFLKLANHPSRTSVSRFIVLQKRLCVFSRRVILQTCSIGLRSGE